MLACLGFGLLCSSSFADKLYHVDGSIIEGQIVDQNADKILIKTKYGTLNYDRSDLVKIERSGSAGTQQTSGTASAGPMNLMQYIPKGPVNPMAPPQIPALFSMAPKPSAAPVAAGTPGAVGGTAH
jgi:hypothetical protein